MVKNKRIIVLISVMFVLVLGTLLYKEASLNRLPEVKELEGKEMDFGELSIFFTKLAQTKGPVYAYEVLKIASLPANTDMHLLGHVVGDELYKQQGIQGMSTCTQDFRNACSHSIVVGYFLKHGEAGLVDIAEACRNAPGGSGAYTMCFHGLGHGVLAAVDYDLPRTVRLCQKTGTAQYGFREAAECTGGAVMEIISGGFHNKQLWEKQSTVYLSLQDPLLPCSADYMPRASRGQCLEYLTPHLVSAAGGSFDEGVPGDDVLRVAFRYCEGLAQDSDRMACYQGFGKEFIVLVHARDTRSITQMSDDEMRQVFALCAIAGNSLGELACLVHAVDSLYWGGENDSKAAIRFCSIMQSKSMQESCFAHLIGAMKYFVQDEGKRMSFCRKLPEAYEKACNEK